uniref:Polyadenylate-binding protein 2 n=1 Tax=Cajanus cajan TaxID=3821 RepID=A0A151QRC7_CAJCA|nr:Polyadenylate-binding protein 2 [Cajanus cajan]
MAQTQEVSGANHRLQTNTALYVGDLHRNVTKDELYNLFNQIGNVSSVKICENNLTGESLADKAIEELNFTPLYVDHKALRDMFSPFGTIVSYKIATDDSGESKGFGFVQFETEQSAKSATYTLNGTMMNGKQVYVGPFVRKENRESTSAASGDKFTNVYVKSQSISTTADDLKRIFGEYGAITSAVVMKNSEGVSKCFGFINFASADDAAKAVGELNGKTFDGKEWYVGKAMKKSERLLELKEKYGGSEKESAANLYVKNLNDSIGDAELKDLFLKFGTITSCKVMQDEKGFSRGSGFVAFSKQREAIQAVTKLFTNEAPHVALAPRLLPFPLGSHSMGEEYLYGQTPPFIIPPRQGEFGYQQHCVPGMRLVGQEPGGHGGAGAPMPLQPLVQQQMLPRGPFVYHHAHGPVAYGTGGQAMPFQSLVTALANASPEMQRQILGDALYPLVENLVHDSTTTGRVTGMLLDLDQPEVLHLLEEPNAFRIKVDEMINTLRDKTIDRLKSISILD